jgi:uncharacterized OB-fold protein
MSELPVREPHPTLETLPFWEACVQERLVLPRCDRCEAWIWYPRRLCPTCGSREVTWTEVAGTGSIYSVSVVRAGGPGTFRHNVPYAVAVVELDEGPRLLTNVVGADPGSLRIGQRARVVFERGEGGAAVPRFTPA